MKKFFLLAGLIVALAGLGVGAFAQSDDVSPVQNKLSSGIPKQPTMANLQKDPNLMQAYTALRGAHTALSRTKYDYNGHRLKALSIVDAAIEEIRKATTGE